MLHSFCVALDWDKWWTNVRETQYLMWAIIHELCAPHDVKVREVPLAELGVHIEGVSSGRKWGRAADLRWDTQLNIAHDEAWVLDKVAIE